MVQKSFDLIHLATYNYTKGRSLPIIADFVTTALATTTIIISSKAVGKFRHCVSNAKFRNYSALFIY